MKTIKTLKITHNEKPFLIKVYKTNSPSNYNLFVSVLRKGDKLPLVGKTFRDDSTNEQVKEWAIYALKWPEFQHLIR